MVLEAVSGTDLQMSYIMFSCSYNTWQGGGVKRGNEGAAQVMLWLTFSLVIGPTIDSTDAFYFFMTWPVKCTFTIGISSASKVLECHRDCMKECAQWMQQACMRSDCMLGIKTYHSISVYVYMEPAWLYSDHHDVMYCNVVEKFLFRNSWNRRQLQKASVAETFCFLHFYILCDLIKEFVDFS